MYHIFIPNAGPFDSNVNIYVPTLFDLLFISDLLHDRQFKIDYFSHFVCDGGTIDVNR